MAETYKVLGALIRECREKKGKTQLQVAHELGYDSAQFVSLFERGMSKVPLEVLGKLIVILNVPEKKVMNTLLEAYRKELSDKILQGKKTVAS